MVNYSLMKFNKTKCCVHSIVLLSTNLLVFCEVCVVYDAVTEVVKNIRSRGCWVMLVCRAGGSLGRSRWEGCLRAAATTTRESLGVNMVNKRQLGKGGSAKGKNRLDVVEAVRKIVLQHNIQYPL